MPGASYGLRNGWLPENGPAAVAPRGRSGRHRGTAGRGRSRGSGSGEGHAQGGRRLPGGEGGRPADRRDARVQSALGRIGLILHQAGVVAFRDLGVPSIEESNSAA